MKNKLLLFAIVILTSCTPAKYIEKVEPGLTFVSFLDFQPYLSKGFIFSTGSINQNYTPVGLIDNISFPDIVKKYKTTNMVVTDQMIRDGSGDIIVEGEKNYINSLCD